MYEGNMMNPGLKRILLLVYDQKSKIGAKA